LEFLEERMSVRVKKQTERSTMDVSIWEVYRKEKEVSRSPVGVPEDFFGGSFLGVPLRISGGFLFRSPLMIF